MAAILNFNKKLEEKKKKLSEVKESRIIKVVSGKGGVGKSVIASNLAYLYSQEGKKCLLYDSDYGLGNIDALYGIVPKYNTSHVISGKKNLKDIIQKGHGGVNIISSASGIMELTNLSKYQRVGLETALEDIKNNYDIIIIDFPTGITETVFSFNKMESNILIITTPEPTAMLDTYSLMKIYSKTYKEKDLNLLVNMVDNVDEAEVSYERVSITTNKFLNMSPNYIGMIPFDENLKESLKYQEMVCEMFPDSPSSESLGNVAKEISKLP